MSFLRTSKWGSAFTKVISILIVQAFIVSSVAFAIPTTDQAKLPATDELTTNPDKVVIPREFGLVKTKYVGNNNKLIIHIQDAHCNYEAQSNIVKILDNLVKNYNMSLVSVEGADGNIDTSWFRAFPDEEVRKEVADYFMKKGEITGPEFLSITSNLPIKLFGAETRSYYVQNLNAFMSSYPSKDETEKYYNQIKTALNRLKGFIYSDELKTMDAKMQEYESKKMQFNDYVRLLQAMAEKHKINLRGYDNLFKLTSVLLYEKKIDFNVTDKERSALIDELSKTLSKDALAELVTQSISFKSGRIASAEYYNYLKNLARQSGIDLSKRFPNLANYIIYNSIYSRIENDKLFADIKKAEVDIKEKLFQNDDQRSLEKLSRHIETLLGLINIKLLNEDFEYYKSHKDEFAVEAFCDFLRKKTIQYGLAYDVDSPSDAVVNNTQKLEEFYTIAIKRDEALVDNTLGAMKKNRQDIAVLVTGGFHSEGISKLLERQGVSYMVVCPSITKDVPTPYIQILTNQRTPLENILIGTAEAKETKSGMLAPYLISAARQLEIDRKGLVRLQDIGALQGRLDIAAQFDGIFADQYIERWIDKAQMVAKKRGLPYNDKGILRQAFNMAVDNAAQRENISDKSRDEIKALADTIFDRIDIDREKIAARSLMEERARTAARVAEKVSYERAGATTTARVSAAGVKIAQLKDKLAGKLLGEALELCGKEYEKALETLPAKPQNGDNKVIKDAYKNAMETTKDVAAYKQGLEISRDILTADATIPANIHQITKRIFVKMEETGLPEPDTMPDAALVAIRMEAAEKFLLNVLAADNTQKEKLFVYFTSLVNQYIAFIKLTMVAIAIDPADRALLDKRIDVALNFTKPIQAERERSQLIGQEEGKEGALWKLYNPDIVRNALASKNNNEDEAIYMLLMDSGPGMLRNRVEKVIQVDIMASQRLGTDEAGVAKERELALRFMKTICLKMAGFGRPLSSYDETGFGQVFNENFGVLFAVLAGGSGSRYGLVTHKSHGATFTGMDNVDLTLRGAFHTPIKPAKGQDSHYLISSLFSMLKCLKEAMRLGLLARDQAVIEEEAALWPQEIGMRKVESQEMDEISAERFLPSGTYFLRQEAGMGGYGGSLMEAIKFMINQEEKGKLPNVPYFMRLDGEQATVQEEGVANVALITWMTTVADNNLITLGLREDKVIEGKGMPIDDPLLGVVRFLQDWRNIPPTIIKGKLLALLNARIPANAELRQEVESWLNLSPEQRGLLIEKIHGDTTIEQRNSVFINANIVVMHKDVAKKYFDKVKEHDQLKGQVNDRTNTPEFAPADVSVCVFDDFAMNKPGEQIPLGYSVVSKGPSAIKNTFKQSEFNANWQAGIREMLSKAGVDISELLVLTINPGSDVPVFNLKKAEEMLFGKNGVFFEAVDGKVEGVKLIGKVHIDLRSRIGDRATLTNSYIRGNAKIGSGCMLTDTTLVNINVGDGSTLINCYIKDGRETIPAGSTLVDGVRNIPGYSRSPEWAILDKIYDRSSSSGEMPSEQISEVLAGATFSRVESVLLSQEMNGEDILNFIKELREQELGETDHGMDQAIASGKGNDLNYVAREIIKNMGLFTSPVSMDPSLEGQPLTFPVSTDKLPIYFNIPGMDEKADSRLLYKIVSMFGKTEPDEKKGKLRRIDAIHIMGPLTIANEFTRFGTGVTIDGLETHGRLYAGDGWGIIKTKIPNPQSVMVLGDHVMILDDEGDIVAYEPPLDGDINSLSLMKGCEITARRVYVGPGAGERIAQYRGKILQNVRIRGNVVIIPEGMDVKAGSDIDDRINDVERSLALTFMHKNRDEAYMIMKGILHGDLGSLNEYQITKIGRLTSMAAVICFMVHHGDYGRADDLLDKLMNDEPDYYSQLMNKIYVISQIIDPDIIFKDWFTRNGRSPVPPLPAKLKSYNDIKKEIRLTKFDELYNVVQECSKERIEPALMTTERRTVEVLGVERKQRGFTSEMTPLSTYKDSAALGEVILRHCVIKDPEDLTLLLSGYLAYNRLKVANNDILREGYRRELNTVEINMRSKWRMDIGDDAVVAIYVAVFGPQEYIGIPTDRPFEFACFRGGRGAHWFLNEIKDQLKAMGIKSFKMDMLPGATDDGRSWLLCSLIYEAPGMPDIGKCLMDIAQDRVLADIIGDDNSRFKSIDQLYAFNKTYKAAKEGLTEKQREKMGANYSFALQLYDYGYGKNSTAEMGQAADAINEYIKLFCDKLRGHIRQAIKRVETQNIIIHTLEELREALLNQKVEYPEVNWKDFVDKIWEYLTKPDTDLGPEGRRYIDSVAGVQSEIEQIVGKRNMVDGKVEAEGCLMQDLRERGERRQEILEDKLLAILREIGRKDAQALREFLYAEFCANMTIPKFGIPIRSAALVGAHIHFEESLKDAKLPEMAQLKATSSDIAWQRAIDSLSGFLNVGASSVAPVTLRRYHLSGVAAGEVDKDTGKQRLQLLLSEDSYNEIPKEGEFLFTMLMRKPVLDPGLKKRLRAAAKGGDLNKVIAIFKKASNDASIEKHEVPDIIINPKATDAITQTKLLFLFPTTLMSNIGPAILDSRVGDCVAINTDALKVYIHNALNENDPPHTTAATMLENLYRLLSNQQRHDNPHVDWSNVDKYFSYVVARSPCRYAAFADTYIDPDVKGIEDRVEGNVSTVELDIEDPKSSSKGRYLGPPLMRAVLQLEQLKNLGIRVMDGQITPFAGVISPEGHMTQEAIALQSEVAGRWSARNSSSGAVNESTLNQAARQVLQDTEELLYDMQNSSAAARNLFKSGLSLQEIANINVELINDGLEMARTRVDARFILQNFLDHAGSMALEMAPQDSAYARDISLIVGQATNIISWISRDIPGAIDMRLTTDEVLMVKGDSKKYGPSFLAKPENFTQAEAEGKPGIYWRDSEGLGNVQGLKNKMGDINMSEIAMKDRQKFDAARNNGWLYLMDHGWLPVPAALEQMTKDKAISTIHETSFLTDTLPGSIQFASTGPGHFQKTALDLKYVTAGEGIQYNKFYDQDGKLVAVYAQYLKPGSWAVALPFAVDSVENLGGLRFNDISVKVAEAAQWMQKSLPQLGINFAEVGRVEESEESKNRAVTNAINNNPVPYYAVNINGEARLVKNTETKHDFKWVNGIPSLVGEGPLTSIYSALTPERVVGLIGTVRETMSSQSWTEDAESVKEATPEEVMSTRQSASGAVSELIIYKPTSQEEYVTKEYPWKGTGIAKLMRWGAKKIAEIWFFSVQKDGLSKIPGQNVTLAETINANPESMLGPGMKELTFFTKFLGKDENQPQMIHLGFNAEAVRKDFGDNWEGPQGFKDYYVGKCIEERKLMKKLKDVLTQAITNKDDFENYKLAYEAWVSEQVKVRWANSGLLPQLPALPALQNAQPQLNEIFGQLRGVRQELVKYLNEIKLEPGQVILAPVGYIHSIVGSHQGHPLTGSKAKNEAWYIFSAGKDENGRDLLIYFEPQQTSNTTYSPFDFPTGIDWVEEVKGQPKEVGMRKDIGRGLDKDIEELLKPGESKPADDIEAIKLIAERAFYYKPSKPEDFVIQAKGRMPQNASGELYTNRINATATSLIQGAYSVWPNDLWELDRVTLDGRGDIETEASITLNPIPHSFHELVVTQGEVEINIGGKTDTLTAGSSVFVPYSARESYQIKSKGVSEVLRIYPPAGSKASDIEVVDRAKEILSASTTPTLVVSGQHMIRPVAEQLINEGKIGATPEGMLYQLETPVAPATAITPIIVRHDRNSASGAEIEKITAEWILANSTMPDRNSLQDLVRAISVSDLLDDRAIVVACDTGVDPNIKTSEVIQAGERSINRYLKNNNLINIRSTGQKLLEDVNKTIEGLKRAGTPYTVVTISGNDTLIKIGENALKESGKATLLYTDELADMLNRRGVQYTATADKTLIEITKDELDRLEKTDRNRIVKESGAYVMKLDGEGRVLNIQNPDGRHIPIIGLYELALRIAYNAGDIEGIERCLKRIAYKGMTANGQPIEFGKEDIARFLTTGIISILPQIVPEDMNAAREAYKAAQKALIAL